MTLRFIGEVDEGVASDLDEAFSGIRTRPFPVSVAGVGLVRHGGQAGVLNAGVERSQPLQHLHEKVETAAARVGLPPEGRRYTPHVTLARFQGGNPAEIAALHRANNLLHLPEFTADRFALIASYLSRAGSIYEDVAEYALR